MGHRIDPSIGDLFPCFYGGGGSCAFDRRKFLELGGFDELLAPFYLEDTDLGYLAWKRGWQVLYQPRSVVYHEHRGTIGKRFSEAQIQAVLKKNYLLFCWKNIHDWRMLASHFFFSYGGALLSVISGDRPGRANLDGWWRAFQQLPGALASRWRARGFAVIDDTEAFRRPLGGYFHDRFSRDRSLTVAALQVLFVSPYPICPPVHGGGVFMYHTLRELAKLARCTSSPCWTTRRSCRAGRIAHVLRLGRIRSATAHAAHLRIACGRTPSPNLPMPIWIG